MSKRNRDVSFSCRPQLERVSRGVTIMKATDTITIVEGYDAMRIFLEAIWRHHGKTNEEIKLLVGALKWVDGTPVDPTMWEDWLAALQTARVGRTNEIAET